MRKTLFRICIILAACLALEAAVFVAWNLVHRSVPAETAETEVRTEPSTLPPTIPSVEFHLAETVPTETVPTESLPEETEATQPQPVTIDTVPQYFQTDYPNTRYGTGTIAGSGCNVTALAMVASYMTDHVYYPDEIADDLAEFSGSNHKRLEYGSNLLQLSWKKATNVHDALKAVREGKVVIALMNEKSLFTTGSHFIVLTGVNEEGRILVNDPNEKNYSAWNLKDGFENGFTDGKIIAGFAGGWIYDKSAMPEEPFIYEPVPYAEENRYPGLELTDEEMDLMAKLIWLEAQSEPFEGQQAVAEVILNRYVSGHFQNSIRGIIYADDQFEAVKDMDKAEPTYTQYKAIDRALNGPYVLPIDVVFYATFSVNNRVWGQIGSHIFCYSYYSD